MVDHNHIRLLLIDILQALDLASPSAWNLTPRIAEQTRDLVYHLAALIERIANQ